MNQIHFTFMFLFYEMFLLCLVTSHYDVDNDLNPISQIINRIANDIEDTREEDQSNDPFESLFGDSARRTRIKIKRPKHKSVIHTSGPGFETVEVKEIFNDDIAKDSDEHMRSRVPIEDNKSFGLPIFPNMPGMVIVKTSIPRGNLRSNTGDEMSSSPEVNPFRMFDNIFNDFFKIDNQHFGHAHRPNITADAKQPERNEHDPVKVIEIKDITQEKENQRPKDVVKIESRKEKEKEKEKVLTKDSAMEQTKESSPISSTNNNITATDIVSDRSVIDTNSSNSIFKLFKYCIVIVCIILGIILVKFIFERISQSESPNPPKESVKHSINNIEDELKGLKDKNKFY